MSRTPKQMKTFRENRLELILLGMAIASSGDRERVLDSVDLNELQSPLIARCLAAIITRDPEDVAVARGVFSSWGVKVGSSISGSLIASVNLNNARRSLSKAIEAATDGRPVCIQEAIENVEECLENLKELQKTEEQGELV